MRAMTHPRPEPGLRITLNGHGPALRHRPAHARALPRAAVPGADERYELESADLPVGRPAELGRAGGWFRASTPIRRSHLARPAPAAGPHAGAVGREGSSGRCAPPTPTASSSRSTGRRRCACSWCRRHGRAYVIFTECTPVIDPMLPRWQLALHRRLGPRADGLIAASSAARERLEAFGVPDDQITVALQAADVEPFDAPPRRTSPRPDDGPLKVISVGRLVPDKNFATLIEAVARLHGRAELEIVGTGLPRGRARSWRRAWAGPLRFRGHVSPSELPSLYAAADAVRADQHVRAVRRGGPRGGRRRPADHLHEDRRRRRRRRDRRPQRAPGRPVQRR